MSVKTKNQSVKLSNVVVLDETKLKAIANGEVKFDNRTNNPGRPVNKKSARYIRLKKQALLFGRPWYLTCPGVIYFKDLKNIDELINLKWSLKDIESHIANLSKRMGQGLITIDYYKSEDFFNDYKRTNYDEDKNMNTVVQSLEKIIRSKGN